MNRLPRAWAHFERATNAAREAADPCLLAFAAGEQAYVLLDLHRPAEALAMVRAAYDPNQRVVRRHAAAGLLVRASWLGLLSVTALEPPRRKQPRWL